MTNLTTNPPDPDCPLCEGRGFLDYLDGAHACRCVVKQKGLPTLDEIGVPLRFQSRTFKNYEVENRDTESLSAIISKANQFHRWIIGERKSVPTGLIISGGVGCGKTHLAAAIINLVRVQGLSAMWKNCATLFQEMREELNKHEDRLQSLVKRCSQVPLFVLDDLGAQRDTTWTEEMLYEILNQRYESLKVTVITTNLTPKQFRSSLGYRIDSRLRESCETVILKGADYRETIRKNKGGG